MLKKITATFLAAAVLAGTIATSAAAQGLDGKGVLDFTINSPYANVNWETYGQYKADFHAHSNESDGAPQPADTVEEH